MNINFSDIILKLPGSKVHRPISGTLSGHAAGEPFDKHVYKELKNRDSDATFRQYEFLNHLYSLNPRAVTSDSRHALIPIKSAAFLLNRGKAATQKWKPSNLFEEKQNDTADILIVTGNRYEIIDIKTRNLALDAQPPNIISAFKLAEMAKLIIENNEYLNIGINYISIEWELENEYLVCKTAHYANLFKECPENLYINWAAAMQIQFHVPSLKQDFNGTIREWMLRYLKHFVKQAEKRADDMISKFVKPYLNFLE